MSNVKRLRYTVITPGNVDYSGATDVKHTTSDFEAVLSSNELNIVVNRAVTEEEAIDLVGDFLRTWEMKIGLELRPGEVAFLLSEIEYEGDRKSSQFVTLDPAIVVRDNKRNAYVLPPTDLAYPQYVDWMYQRYKGFTEGKEPLASMAYYCLTVIESNAGGRRKAATNLGIEFSVLEKLGELTSTKGDPKEARKKKGPHVGLSTKENTWIIAAAKKIIYRSSEQAANPGVSRKQITMADLPSL